MKKILYICGYGLNHEQITLETLKTIREADIVISPSIDRDTSNLFGVKIKSTRDLSPQKHLLLIKKLFLKYNKIAFITYGNPCFLNSITYGFKNNLKNIEIQTLPAISSFDAAVNLFNELNLLPSDLVLTSINEDRKSFKFIKDKNMLLFGAESLKNNPATMKIFLEYFKKTYSSSHPVYIITIKDFFYKKTMITPVKINQFEKEIKKAINMITVYIPCSVK